MVTDATMEEQRKGGEVEAGNGKGEDPVCDRV